MHNHIPLHYTDKDKGFSADGDRHLRASTHTNKQRSQELKACKRPIHPFYTRVPSFCPSVSTLPPAQAYLTSGRGDCIGSNSCTRGSGGRGRGRGRGGPTNSIHHVDKQVSRRAIRARMLLLLLLLGTYRTCCQCRYLCPSYCSSCGSWHSGDRKISRGRGVGGVQ